jgi:cytidylate kinase
MTEQRPSKEKFPATFQIALDGPVAAGKGTVSRLVAERLGFLYVDTGAMYRCVAFLALTNHIAPTEEDALLAELRKHDLTLRTPTPQEKDGRLVTVLLDGEDVSWKIRTEKVSNLTSVIAQLPKIRAELVKLQQQLAAGQNVVMEGRDITHTVLPNAQLKIYLDADPIVRAQRRHKELLARGVDVRLPEVLEDLRVRDERDSVKNLKQVSGVWVIDTTHLTISEVIDLIFAKTKQLQRRPHSS